MPIRSTKKETPQEDQNTIELPEVKDIPGQEHILVPPGGILADETASSDDEEGKSILDDATDEDILQYREDADDFPPKTYPADEDDRNIKKLALDNTDDEGDLLNEDTDDLTGEDLDVPGSEEDNDDSEEYVIILHILLALNLIF